MAQIRCVGNAQTSLIVVIRAICNGTKVDHFTYENRKRETSPWRKRHITPCGVNRRSFTRRRSISAFELPEQSLNYNFSHWEIITPILYYAAETNPLVSPSYCNLLTLPCQLLTYTHQWELSKYVIPHPLVLDIPYSARQSIMSNVRPGYFQLCEGGKAKR